MWRENCPAKLNLYLAVTGRRADGFHDLVSLVAKLDLCDTLEAVPSTKEADCLACDDAELSAGPDNLVLKAAAAYRSRVPAAPFLAFTLTKRVPYGAGLGGGSSDAAAALRIMNAASGHTLGDDALRDLAAGVGSDCPLFLVEGPCLMRGRGELLSLLTGPAADALMGRTLLLAKPHFGISTPWAYSSLAPASAFIPEAEAEAELSAWLAAPRGLPPLRNSFQKSVYAKYFVYNVLNKTLTSQTLPALVLTGSGSAAFAFCEEDEALRMEKIVREHLGADAFVRLCSLG